jgi:LPS export ABC transporter permease LptG
MRAPWLGRYARVILITTFVHISLACLVGLLLFAVVDFVEIGNLARANASTASMLELILSNMPATLRTVLPVATPVGGATALGALLRRRELVAFFAAGASPWACWNPLIVLGLLLGLVHTLNVEFLVSSTRARVVELRHELGLGRSTQDGMSEQRTWFKGRDHLFRVESVLDENGTRLARVLILSVKDGALERRVDAASIFHEPAGWRGQDVVIRRFREGQLSTVRRDGAPLGIEETPEDFVRAIAAPSRLRYNTLRATTAARARLGQPDEVHRVELHRRHGAPFFLLALLLAAASAALRLGRNQSFAKTLLVGAAMGFGGWVVWEISGLFGVTRALPPSFAPYLPVLLALVLACGLIAAVLGRGIADRAPGIRLTPFSG